MLMGLNSEIDIGEDVLGNKIILEDFQQSENL